MNKQPELRAQTRQALMDAFFDIYRTTRLEKITVREITQKAGYHRGTFYEYFKDTHDVLMQIEDSLIPKPEDLPPHAMPTRHFGMPMDFFLKLYEKNSDYYAVLMGSNGDPVFTRKLKDSTKPLITEVLRTQFEGTEEELLATVEYTVSAMIGVMSDWYQRGKPMDSKALLQLTTDIMHHGVGKRMKSAHD